MIKGLKQNKLAFSIGAYTLVNIINKGIPFLLLPLLTNFLTPEDYGILTNIESLLVVTVTLVGINLSSAISRQYVKEGVDMKSYIITTFRVILVSFLAVTLIYAALADLIFEFTAIPKEVIYFVSFYAILDNIMEALLAFWRMEDKPFRYGALRVSRTVIELIISVVLVVVMKYDWFGRFTGIYLAGIAGGLFALFYFIKQGYLRASYEKTYRRHFLKYGMPLIPHSISGVLIFYSDKIAITKLLGVAENGVYSVAFTIGMAISLLQNSFNQAWVPWLFKKLALDSDEENKKLVKITYGYMAVMLLMVILLWLLAPVIYMVIGDDFSDGVGIVAIVGLGFAFNGMYKMMINYVFYAEKTKIISIMTISLAAFNIGLNIIFIKMYGIIGSAYASALTFFVQFMVAWFISQKVHPMPWFKLK